MSEQLAERLHVHDLAPVADELALHAPVGEPGLAVRGQAHRDWLRRRLLAVADVLTVTLAFILVLSVFGSTTRATVALLWLPLIIVPLKVAGLYDRDQLRLVHSTLDEAPALAQITGLVTLGVAISQPLVLDDRLGAAQTGALWSAAFAAILVGRFGARRLAGWISAPERCLVIGEPPHALHLREKLASSRARASVVATLPLRDEDWEDTESADEIRELARALALDRIIIVPTTSDAESVLRLIRVAKAVGVRVSVLPRMFEVVGSAVEFDDVDGVTMLGIPCFGLSPSSRLLKRSFDLAVTSVGVLLAAPLMGAIALAIRLDSKGPVLFRQVRVGRDGRHFSIFKFRTMVVGAEARKDELRARNEAGAGLFKLTEDPRVTRVGRVLRSTSLDELPQLCNVIRGEMSVVGPRPLVVDEDAQVLGLDRSRLHLTPGMTGPWQVLGTRVPMREMVGIDYLYVANWSLWLDVKILLRTAGHVVRRANR